MELFRAGEAVIRSSQPLLPFLAPSVFRSQRSGAIARHCRTHQIRPPTSRAFASSCLRQQQSAATARPKEEDDESTQANSTDAEFQALIDSAMEAPSQPPRSRPHRHPGAYKPSSTDRLAALFPDDPSGDNTTSPSQPKYDISSIFSSNPSTQAKRTGPPPPPPPPQPAPMRLNSSLGRTIAVDPERGMDVGRAFRVLEMRCSQNQVKRQHIQQRFHERPGLKRKRLKRERWRRRFKENFKETVTMVQRMRKQGW